MVTSQLPAGGHRGRHDESPRPRGVRSSAAPAEQTRRRWPPAASWKCASTRRGRSDRPRAHADDGAARRRDATRSRTCIPVEVLASPETVAAYGEAADATTSARETLTMPAGVVPGFGGLHVELSSTAMVGLGEGARYLVEYPYGCAEQRGVAALALLLAADLGDAFALPGIDAGEDAAGGAAHAEGARDVPVRRRRLRLLAGRVPARRRRT